MFVWTAESEWHDSFLLSPSVADTRWETDLYSRSTRLRNYCCSRLPTHTKITTLIHVNLLSGAFLRLLNTYPKRRHLNQRCSKALLTYTGIFCHFRGFNIFSGLFGHVQSVVDWHLLDSSILIVASVQTDPLRFFSKCNFMTWANLQFITAPNFNLRRCLICQNNWQHLWGWAEALMPSFFDSAKTKAEMKIHGSLEKKVDNERRGIYGRY